MKISPQIVITGKKITNVISSI